MSTMMTMLMIVGRKYLEEYFNIVLNSLKIVVVNVGVVFLKKSILDEFEKKGFNSFNSKVKGWKLMANLNKFEIFTLDPVET